MKRKTLILVVMLIILLFTFPSPQSLHMGKGTLCKYVFWDTGEPISRATVGLDIDGDGIVDITQGTDINGKACFFGLPYGTYYIYVDIDNDGVWDTVAEEATINQNIVTVRNVYDSSPEMWSFGTSQTKR